MVAPAGAVSRLKVSVSPASGSVAVAGTITVPPTVTLRSGMAARTGGGLPAVTTLWNVRAARSGGEPLSVTRTVTAYGPAAWLVPGAQVKRPVAGSMAAPAGAPAKL